MKSARDRFKILLAEDETLIGFDLVNLLEDAGYEVLGPAITVDQAISLLEQEHPDLAVIDIVLRDGAASALAAKLRQMRIPFAVHSGSLRDASAIAAFSDAPWLAKPASGAEMLAVVQALATPVPGTNPDP